MLEHFEQFDLTQGSDGKAVALIVHEDLFKSHDCTGPLRSTFGNDTKCALAELRSDVEVGDPGTAAIASLCCIDDTARAIHIYGSHVDRFAPLGVIMRRS